MKSTKNIKVYGTLVNGTLDTSVSDNDHNDVLMNAYQLYDGRFGATPASANFLDVINKRLTGITYADGDTTITGDLIVTGSIIGGDLGAHNLSELRDVNIAGIGANKYLKYDGTKWVPSLISLVDISEFDGLNGAVEGQVLKYRNGKWRPSADLVGENPITTINGLDDVDTTGATNGSVLKYNGTTWVVDTDNQTTSLNGLSDVNTSGAVNGSVLKYNGTTWVVGADNTGNNGATDLNGLSDVALSSSSSNQVLSYNGSQWVNKTISLSDLSMPSAQEGQVLKYSNGSWIAANDEQGSGQSGTQLGVYTEVRTFQKIGEVSNTFFNNITFTEGRGNTIGSGWGYLFTDNDKMDMYINPLRNKYYIYTAPNNVDPDKPESIGYAISKFEGLPSNMYSYSYKNNNILTLVPNTGTTGVGLPDFSSASTQEGMKRYYKTTPLMIVNLWTGSSSSIYELNSTPQNGYFSRSSETITVTNGSDDSFLNRSAAFVDGNSVKYYYNGTLVVGTTSGYLQTNNLSLSEVKNALTLNNIPAIQPGYFYVLILAADDIDMPLTFTQTLAYNYIA